MKKWRFTVIGMSLLLVVLFLTWAIPSLAGPGEPRPGQGDEPVPEPTIDWSKAQLSGHDVYDEASLQEKPENAPAAIPGTADSEAAAPEIAAPPNSNETAVQVIPPVISSSGDTYTVRPGDTLYQIARHFQVSLNALITVNKLTNPSLIYAGQVLTLPGNSSPPPTNPTPIPPAPPTAPVPPTGQEKTHIVQRGEILARIASHYGVTIQALVTANNISNPNRIYVGQILTIPGQAAPPVQPTPLPDPPVASPEPILPAPPPEPTLPAPTPDPAGESTFIWPAESRRLYQYFRYGHTAIDIDVWVGTEIKASAAGRVEYSGWNGYGYGYLVVIDHPNGFRTIYAHNSQLLVETGQEVRQGQVVSLSGSTGYSTVPHLHFGILENGRAVNPCLYLPGGC